MKAAKIFRENTVPLLVFCLSVTCIVGLVLLVMGLLLTAKGNEILGSLIPELLSTYNEFIDDLPSIFPENYHVKLTGDQPVFGVLFKEISTMFLVLGSLFTISALFGCFININTRKPLLFLYMCLVINVTLVSIGCMMSIENVLVREMRQGLESYSGLADRSDKGVFWNLLMVNFECCGVESYKDFEKLDNWPPEDLRGFTVNRSVVYAYQLELQKKYPEARARGCYASVNDTDIFKCDWADSNMFMTPMMCCRDALQVRHGCHVWHVINFTNAANNRMSEGCLPKTLDLVTSKTAANVVFIIALVTLMMFVAVLVAFIFVGDTPKELEVEIEEFGIEDTGEQEEAHNEIQVESGKQSTSFVLPLLPLAASVPQSTSSTPAEPDNRVLVE